MATAIGGADQVVVRKSPSFPTRTEYLVAELRCAALRARLQLADIEAVGLALKCGLIEPEQALELLADCDCLQFIQPTEPEL